MKPLSRRAFVQATALAATGALLLGTRGVLAAQDEPPGEVIGFSQAGAPLTIYRVGDGPTRVFLLGGQHGGPEANTIGLVQQLQAHFEQSPDELPGGVGLDIMPIGNPDGAVAGSRQYLSGVDPNRNWGGPDWQTDAFDSNGRYLAGLGGPEPFSEQETQTLAEWLRTTRPALVINYHSAGGFMFGGRDGLAGEIARAYSDASGYPRPTAGGGGSPLSYRATGSMNVWLREIQVAGLFIELTTPYDPEVGRNLYGLRAALATLSAG
jgi:hypothetical protein